MNLSARKQRVVELYEHARRRWPLFDHAVRATTYFGEVLGSQLAAGVTYYAFLSFFPLVALAFAVVGFVVDYVPGAEQAVTTALSELLPGMVGDAPGQIDVRGIAASKAGVGIIGLLGLIYAGLGWMGALRTAIERVFQSVHKAEHNPVTAKLLDLVGLVVLGFGLVTIVTVGATLTSFTGAVADWLGWSDVAGIEQLLQLLSFAIGVVTATVLFYVMYWLLPDQRLPFRRLVSGALIAGVGFEVLKQLAGLVLRGVTSNVLYGAFVAVVALLVWIHYAMQLIVFGAAWAVTASTTDDGRRRSSDDGQ